MSAVQTPTWADGALHRSGAGLVHASDPGFLLGLAVFETLLWEDQVLYFVEEHLERFERSARGLGLSLPPWSPRAALEELCAELDATARGVRMTLTPGAPGCGPSLFISANAWQQPDPAGVGLLLVPRAKLAGDPLESLKTSSRLRNALARRSAQAVGAWDAVLATDEGDFTEGTVSNLFAVLDGQLMTPPTERGALAGIVRDKLFEDVVGEGRLGLVERRIELEDLARAEEVFMTNSLARIVPVAWIHELRSDLPGAAGACSMRATRHFRASEAHYRALQVAQS